MKHKKHKVILFFENETLQKNPKNIKRTLLPKNTTSQLQSLNAGILRSFKHKYSTFFLHFAMNRISEGQTYSSGFHIVQDAHVLKTIT